jgi:hypothetical protein
MRVACRSELIPMSNSWSRLDVAREMDERHAQYLLEVEAAYKEAVTSKSGSIDARFMHALFCVAGMPLREPSTRTFSRSTGTMGLNISRGSITLPDGQELEIGIPYGPKARLIVLYAISEARSPLRSGDNRWLEIGQIEDWLKSIGVLKGSRSGQIMTAAKDQLIRLCLSQFTTTYRMPGRRVLLANDRIIDAGAFDEDELRLYAAREAGDAKRLANLSKVRWPEGIRLSEKAFRMFRGEDAVAIPPSRLSVVSHSALAIDVFLFLCYTLPSIAPGEPRLVKWTDLTNWFGNRKDAPSKFRDSFLPALSLAMKAYPEANLTPDDITDKGMMLHHSDPAALKRAFIAMPRPEAPPTPVKRRKRRKVEQDQFAFDSP